MPVWTFKLCLIFVFFISSTIFCNEYTSAKHLGPPSGRLKILSGAQGRGAPVVAFVDVLRCKCIYLSHCDQFQ